MVNSIIPLTSVQAAPLPPSGGGSGGDFTKVTYSLSQVKTLRAGVKYLNLIPLPFATKALFEGRLIYDVNTTGAVTLNVWLTLGIQFAGSGSSSPVNYVFPTSPYKLAIAGGDGQNQGYTLLHRGGPATRVTESLDIQTGVVVTGAEGSFINVFFENNSDSTDPLPSPTTLTMSLYYRITPFGAIPPTPPQGVP